MKRREFIVQCGLGSVILPSLGTELMAMTPGLSSGNDHIFLNIFLRGGCDGLNLVAPSSDRIYNESRPGGLKVTEKQGYELKNGPDGVGFRFHPEAAELSELYDNGDLAVLHASGLTSGTRSHFQAMDFIERGIDRSRSNFDGWMTRLMQKMAPDSEIPAVSLNSNMPQSLFGYDKSIALKKVKLFRLENMVREPELIRKMYTDDSEIAVQARLILETIDKFSAKRDAIEFTKLEVESGETLANRLATLADLVRMDVGLRVANVDYGGWDTHDRQEQVFPELVRGLSKAVHAFYNEMHEYHGRLTILIMSEFGRRLRANRSDGTDHGFGNMMMVLGGQVRGGQMHGVWPGLEAGALDKGVDLDITTDYRSVLSEIVAHSFGADASEGLFPAFTAAPPMGIFKA